MCNSMKRAFTQYYMKYNTYATYYVPLIISVMIKMRHRKWKLKFTLLSFMALYGSALHVFIPTFPHFDMLQPKI